MPFSRKIVLACPAGLALLSLLTATGWSAPDSREVAHRPVAGRELGRGKFLVAARQLRDPNFARSVVLLVDYSHAGAMGLIVNRRSSLKLAEVLPSNEEVTKRGDDLYLGGPVQPTRLMVLAHAVQALADGVRVFDHVQLILTKKGLEGTLVQDAKVNSLRAYAGHAGWAPGQLEREVARGDWHVLEAEVGQIFASEPRDLWRELLDGAAGRWVWVGPPGAPRV